MGVTTLSTRTAPWWLTWVAMGGLAALFLGERMLGGPGVARLVISGAGAIVLVGCTAWRFLSWRAAEGDGKGVEGLLLACYAGSLAAVAGFFLSSGDGMALLGIDFEDAGAEGRYETALQVLSSIVLAVSLLPALGAQWALSAHRHAGSTAVHVESQRVRETAGAALTVALAGSGLMLAGYTASEWDKIGDFSYFKTASPGTGAVEMVSTMSEPLEALLFFPAVSQVKDEVTGYLRALADATDNVVIEEHDRILSPDLARQHNVTTDNTIVLIRGSRSERLNLPAQIGTARARLRNFDREIQEHLWRLARDQRTAYLTVGHGELADPSGADVDPNDPLQKIDVLKQGLEVFNYRVENLGLQEGLGQEIPADAAMVLVVGPTNPFLEAELETLDRYLAGGGSVLLAVDPESGFAFGPLEQRLGVRYQSVTLANDRQYVRRRGNASDRQLIITDQFTAHESVTALSRTQVGSGILMVGAGYLEPVEGGSARPRFVIRSLPTTFADVNGNYEFDGDTEARQVYSVAAAVEGDVPGDDDDEAPAPDDGGAPGMRALVFTDAGMFTDGVLNSIALNTALAADAIRWLGGDEEFTGDVSSEDDVPIVHTRAEDVAWFYSTILGAPLLVLAAGIVTVVRRRSGRRVT